ncbi:hypothetical protein DENSPDRAFT_690347 [Dentipellis sp. KUC8613]|nr:hypothetical protein DENSPDRAFT_690347 [Dentipellis sp. KUC8613]
MESHSATPMAAPHPSTSPGLSLSNASPIHLPVSTSECRKTHRRTRSAKQDFKQQIAAQLEQQGRKRTEEIASCFRQLNKIRQTNEESRRENQRLVEHVQRFKDGNKEFAKLCLEFEQMVDKLEFVGQKYMEAVDKEGEAINMEAQQIKLRRQALDSGSEERAAMKQAFKDFERRSNIHSQSIRDYRRSVRQRDDNLRWNVNRGQDTR